MSADPKNKDLMDDGEGALVDGRKWRIPTWFPELGEEKLQQLRIFHFELISFNGRMNLISPRTESVADALHFSDSIIAGRVILKRVAANDIFDIGSGNGLPGLIMAVLDPNKNFHLIDSDARKIEFLKHAAHRMGLKNVFPRQLRVEDLPHGAIQVGVSRGFASISKALVLTRKQFAKNGEYYHMKGDAWVREVAAIPSQVCAAWSPRLVSEYELPDNGPKLAVVVTKRTG